MLHTDAQPLSDPAPGRPVLRAGLRPFYLLAACAAAVSVPVWVAVLLWPVPWQAPMPPQSWHGHEMLFGFAAATVTGFLLGARRAWDGLGVTRATALGLLALLWLAGRLALFALPYPLYAAIDLALLPIVAAVLLRQMWRTGLLRNLPLATIVALLALANLVFHLSVLRVLDLPPRQALHAALGLLVVLQAVMAGRVIPGLTISATPGLRIARWPALEKTCLVATATGMAMWIAAPPAASWLTAPVLALAAACHALRQWRWRTRVVWRRPVLWILHAAYAWIAVGLALLACAGPGWLSPSAGVHALGVGATGGLVIGMMARTARGHTGRTLRVGRSEVLAYGLVLVAALVRVLQALVPGVAAGPLLVTAAAAWSTAFAIFLWIYTPWLLRGTAHG